MCCCDHTHRLRGVGRAATAIRGQPDDGRIRLGHTPVVALHQPAQPTRTLQSFSCPPGHEQRGQERLTGGLSLVPHPVCPLCLPQAFHLASRELGWPWAVCHLPPRSTWQLRPELAVTWGAADKVCGGPNAALLVPLCPAIFPSTPSQNQELRIQCHVAEK